MKWNSPTSMEKTVEARASNRPIKVAYLVPFEDDEKSNLILDAVFYESYTRWGGLYTLVVPIRQDAFENDAYAEWMRHYDPDFIYSYVDLSETLVDRIDRLCCPITFLKHEIHEPADSSIRWRSYLPNWTNYVQAVPSISTAQSPESYPQLHHEKRPPEPTVLVQYGSGPFNRFLADNFGVGSRTQQSANPIPGLFRTLCLVPPGLPSSHISGSERCESVLEAFKGISDRQITPISRLASIHSSGVPRTEAMKWAFAFRLIIGNSTKDRINFWNARLLGSSWSDTTNALILERTFFEDEASVIQLGHFLNKHNFLGRGSGPYQVVLHSSSESAESLVEVKNRLYPHTFSSVHVSEDPSAPAIPTEQDLKNRSYAVSQDRSVLKLTEDISQIIAEEPAHFMYLPPQRKQIGEGQWIVELDIDRHLTQSRFSSVVTWNLPFRRRVTRAFTDRLAKPTRGGALALLPSNESFPIRQKVVKNPSKYELRLPTDEDVFRHLAIDYYQHALDDVRRNISSHGYADIATSDKGQNLRGVVSMFAGLSEAYKVLTHKYWRAVLGTVKEDKLRPLHFEMNKLEGLLPPSGDRTALDPIAKELGYADIGSARKYLVASLWDTLEYLIKIRVFFQVAHWRCRYCGHSNARSFDNMKIKNECEICATEFYAPIDLNWQYEINGFVHRAMMRGGLPVLWTLGRLQQSAQMGSFWYMPEVDLFIDPDDDTNKNEIDILCSIAGALHAVEVKTSVSTFVNDPESVSKFVGIIERLRPDVAVLAFARYCSDDMLDRRDVVSSALAEAVREIEERLKPWIKVRVMIAENDPEYGQLSPDLGYFGKRVSELNKGR